MRITRKILEKQVDRLNKLTNSPIHSWSQEIGPNKNKAIKANIGNFHIEGAYDNLYCLNRMVTEGGACSIVFHYMKARELYDCIDAFMSGIEFGRKQCNVMKFLQDT